MKSKNLLITSLLLISLASCNKVTNEETSKKEESTITITESSSSSVSESSSSMVESTSSSSSIEESSSSATINDNVIENDDYYWAFEEEQSIKGTYDFSVSTNIYDESLSLDIDDQKVERLAKNNLDSYLYYETKDCNSDNANRAADYIYLNGNQISKLPSDGSKGIKIGIDDIDLGPNVISITIGGWWGGKELDYKSPLTGAADDFFIGNMYLETSTHLKLKPYKMVFHKAKKNSGTFAKYDIEYQEGKLYYIGDGWSGQLAYDGSTFKKADGTSLDCPQKIDFYFDYELPEAISSYSIDTTKYLDGVHKFTMKNIDGEIVRQNHIIIDNNAPTITSSIKNFAHINRESSVEINISDADVVAYKKVELDGFDITEGVDLTTLTSGTHNISMYAKDRAGNDVYDYRTFYLEDYYQDVNIPSELVELTYTKESKTLLNNKYDEIVISNVDSSKDVFFKYKGTSTENEEIVLSAYNVNTSSYDVVSKIMSGEEVNVKFKATNYTNNENKVIVKASTNYIGNGSNKILWASDTQYLPKNEYAGQSFSDINPFYKQLTNYISSQYKLNQAAYFVHTGDVVDDNPQNYDDETLRFEWNNASEAFKVLDDNNVPYGVSAGNHDVGTDIHNVNYSYFSEFFGNDRFSNSPQYAGSLNNNECHYDLMTVGNYDFIFLYIGFGIEATEEVTNWTNNVLAKYRHRNAIICTHGYLREDGSRDSAIQAEDIFKNIVKPNSNVKFVFCGHTDGSQVVKQILDGGRVMYEVLNCYQFVEQGKYTNTHKINGYNCNGEGFLKSVVFENDTVTFKTYSPITGVNKDPYSNIADSTFNIDLIEQNHILETDSFKAVQ